MSNFVKLIVSENGLSDGHYVEPFAGGAGVALALLYEEYVSHIHINDLNRSVFAFWHTALHDTEELCRRIENVDVSMAEWQRQKRIQESIDTEIEDLAFSTFFLNRTNRSGNIWGGVIGGKNQQGPWTLDARFNKPDLIDRIRKVGRYADRVTLTNLDAEDLLDDLSTSISQNSLTYLDPPYFGKGAELYFDHYKPDDHIRLSNRIKSYGRPWLVSYDNTPETLILYEDCRRLEYGIHYSAQSRYKGSEVIFFSDDLHIPEVDSPSCIPRSLLT